MEWNKYFTISDYAKLSDEQPKPSFNIRSSEELARASAISKNYPWLQPQTISSLAKYNASQETVRMVGEASAMRELGQYGQKLQAQGDTIAPVRYAFDAAGWMAKSAKAVFDAVVPGTATFLVDNVYDPLARGTVEGAQQYVLKPTVRWSTAVFDAVPETVQNVASMAVGSSNYDLFGLWESTSIATMLDNWDNTGDGYFMSQTLREEQAKRARAFRGTIYGNAFTIGRAATSWAGENSLIYKYGSGVIDAAILLAVPDPSLYVGKAIAKGASNAGNVLSALQRGENVEQALKSAGEVVPFLTKEDAKLVKQILREDGAVIRSEAGLASGINGEGVDANKFINFMLTNPLAIKLVDTLIEKTNRLEILEDVFKFEIDTDVADALALATSREEVISALTKPFIMGENTLDPRIGRYRVRKGQSALLKTRFFTQMPKNSIVVSGDTLDNLEAVRNMTLSLRTSGVSEEAIKAWGDEAIQSFSSRGSAPAKYEAFGAYSNAIKLQLKANGIEDPIIAELFKRHNSSLDKVRTYLVDRMGTATDNGHLQMMANLLAENASDEVYVEFLQRVAPLMDEASFAGPAKLVHMLDRTQVMPDARELRRLTRNPLFQKAFDLVGANPKKFAFAGKKKQIDVIRYTDQQLAKELQDQILEIKALPKTDETVAQLTDLDNQLTAITRTEKIRALSGEARLAVDVLDFMQNRIWKPLNLATIGYIVRNGMDAQIRMAFGGVRSVANSGVLHPLEYIHIAIGLPGKGTKYGKSITGVDMTNLGVARKTMRSGEATLETAARQGDYIFVGEERFPATAAGLRKAQKYAKRTGKPLFQPELEAEFLDGATAASVVQQQLAETIGNVSTRVGFTPSDEVFHQVRTGSFPTFARGTDGSYETSMHTKGVVELMQQATKNETTRIVARGIAQGKSDQQIAEEVADWLLANKNSPAYRDIKALQRQGRHYKSEKHPGGDYNLPLDFDYLISIGREDIVRQTLINDALAIDIANQRMLTGKIPELEFLAAYDGVGDLAAAQAVTLDRLTRRGAGTGPIKVGGQAELDGVHGIVTKIQQVSEDAPAVATFVPLLERHSLTGHDFGKSGQAARKLIERTPISPDGQLAGLPVKVPSEQILRKRGKLGEFEQLGTVVDYATGWLFNILNDTAVRRLERSVTFRQYYYQEVGKHVSRLSLEEGRRLHADVLAKAQEEGKTIREYLGEGARQKNRISDKIEALATRTEATGTLQVKDLDDFARFVGLSRTKELLYDATNQNNMVDALRIVMPFAQAWKDVIGTYMMLGAQHNIHMVRQFSRVYKGIEQADPDQDGRGFLFRDPQTKEMQFSFPLSGSLSKLFTGIDAPLSAPLGRLSQGINVYPALGPYAQFAVSKLLPDSPKYDDVKELLIPYGETDVKGLFAGMIPGTIKKGIEAIVGDTENQANTYGNTYIEVLRALSISPKYDLSTEQGQLDLMSDAKSRARILTSFRMMSQFLGPAAGTFEWKVPTKIGDQYVGVMIEELRKLQTDDYDTAVDRFLQMYGDEMVLYIGSKSRALKDGLEATREFGAWERENKDIINQYEKVGTYFAPMGSEYNYSVWERQLQEGTRERLSDRELIDLAQKRVASAKFRALRLMFPANPNEKQRSILATYRAQLHQEFPGFPSRPEYEVGKFANSLDELENAIKDPRLQDNPITAALKEYLDTRRVLAATKGGLSFASAKKSSERSRLFLLGESLAKQNPEFDRIWTRLLSQEVD